MPADPTADPDWMSDQATTSRPFGFERLRQRPERTTSVTLAFDPNDAERLNAARLAKRRADAALDRAGAVADPDTLAALTDAADAATDALDALEAEMVTFTVHLRAVGAARAEELMLEHRPTDRQRKNAKALNNGDPKAQPQFNEDTFPPALLAESISRIEFSDGETIDHISVEQVAELWADRWPQGDKVQLLHAAIAINQASSAVGDLGKG